MFVKTTQSGIEEIAIFDKAARLFAADKSVVFRLTEKDVPVHFSTMGA